MPEGWNYLIMTALYYIGKRMKKTKKAFRELLNKQDLESSNPRDHKHGVYHQRTRLYGDYLYNQDRDKFEANYREWLQEV